MPTPRRYDPELAVAAAGLPSTLDLADPAVIAGMRAGAMAVMGAAPPPREDVLREDLRVPGHGGDPEVPVRVYRPREAALMPRGAVLEIHGGGFLFGDLAMMDAWCDRVAAELDAVVVSVDYRLAPEHPFPAALHDCRAALDWLAANAAALGVDADRIVLAGQSAGGALAAATALHARDHGGPRACFQLLEIPVLDDRLDTPSMQAFTDTPLWTRSNAAWGWRHYLGALHGGDVPAHAAPARAADLSDLPPAYVSTMEFDPLRDEGILYALRLLQAGVPVELHQFPGTFHGSAAITTAEVSRRVTREAFEALGRALRRR